MVMLLAVPGVVGESEQACDHEDAAWDGML